MTAQLNPLINQMAKAVYVYSGRSPKTVTMSVPTLRLLDAEIKETSKFMLQRIAPDYSDTHFLTRLVTAYGELTIEIDNSLPAGTMYVS